MFNENEELLNLWGPAFNSEYSREWYFRMKDSVEKALCIRIFQGEFFEQHIHFNSFELRAVPDGAIVQDYNGN
ncbi:unnamed protein product [Caenorhabditis nigoni]